MSKSPLRYPGGKSRAVKQIREYFPPNLTKLVAPFIGGASIELACANDGITVQGYDLFKPLASFWQAAILDKSRLVHEVEYWYNLDKETYKAFQLELLNIPDTFEQGAAFFVLNRASFSGTTLSGGMNPELPRFTRSSIRRLKHTRTKNLSVECGDFRETIPRHRDDFMYLDPPYVIEQNLYGCRGDLSQNFPHKALAQELKKCSRWVLSYNDCDLVRDLYSDYIIETPEWTYGMGKNKNSKEVLVISG